SRGPLCGPAPTAGKHAPDPFKAALGGTLFLDEVGDLTHEVQGVLLHRLTGQGFECIGDAEVAGPDVRVIAATHRDLQAAASLGRFREDVFSRLTVVRIALPALPERYGDLAPLPDPALARLAARHGRGTIRVSSDTRLLLARYHWPGNHRELVNVL